jgi:hypothetical protein
MNNEEKETRRQNCADEILDLFEYLLEQKRIMIPSRDRSGEETEACLFGQEYYSLEADITEVLADYERSLGAVGVCQK